MGEGSMFRSLTPLLEKEVFECRGAGIRDATLREFGCSFAATICSIYGVFLWAAQDDKEVAESPKMYYCYNRIPFSIA